MANVMNGLDALNLLSEGHENKFTYLKSGDSFKVKIRDINDFIGVISYGIYEKKINTFIPQENPTLNKAGYPIDNLTPFDQAWAYHQELSKEKGDYHSTEASKYRLKPRFAVGFYDLEKEEDIVIDFSRKQFEGLVNVLKRNEQKFNRKAFELTKDGEKQNTVVALTPIDLEEPDLTKDEIKAFENAPDKFDSEMFEDLYFQRNEQEMVDALKQADFDVQNIGYSNTESKPAVNASEDENPFEGSKTYDDVVAEDPTDNF